MNINVDDLLAPIAGELPCGRNMEYEQIYSDIRQARESDPDYLPQGEWATELRKADWNKVVRLSMQVLRDNAKDFQVACWLTEGLSQQYGLPGFLQGIHFLAAMTERYWLNGWPEMDDDGSAIRHGTFNRLDRQLKAWLGALPLLEQPESTLQYWQKVLAYEHRVAMNPDSAKMPGSEDDFSIETFNRWAATVSSQHIQAANDTLDTSLAALTAFETCYQQQNPQINSDAFNETRQMLLEMQDFTQRLFDRAAPAYDDVMTLNVLASQEERQDLHADSFTSGVQQQVMSRDLAISQMLTIAHFFRQTEPSSPVPFLMERAARWAGMTLTEWLQEMLQDDSSLRDINKVLKGQGQE